MYLPSFARVGPRNSRGASRPTRVVFVDHIKAQKKKALRARPPRTPERPRFIPCIQKRKKKEAAKDRPVRGTRQFFRKKERKNVKKQSAPSELLNCFVTKKTKRRKTQVFRTKRCFLRTLYEQRSGREKRLVFPCFFPASLLFLRFVAPTCRGRHT